jgi:hypothetical protein
MRLDLLLCGAASQQQALTTPEMIIPYPGRQAVEVTQPGRAEQHDAQPQELAPTIQGLDRHPELRRQLRMPAIPLDLRQRPGRLVRLLGG